MRKGGLYVVTFGIDQDNAKYDEMFSNTIIGAFSGYNTQNSP